MTYVNTLSPSHNDFGGLSFKSTSRAFSEFGLNFFGFLSRNEGIMWHYSEAYIETNQSCKELVAVRYTNLMMDYFDPRLNGSPKISKA